jgi:hypothetical protein
MGADGDVTMAGGAAATERSAAARVEGGMVPSGAGWAALLCGVQCLVAPALALASPALVLPARYEQAAMLAIALVVAYVLVVGVRAHGRRGPVWPVAAGLALWGVALGQASGPVPEWAVAGAGGVVLFVALRWNARLRARALAHRCGGRRACAAWRCGWQRRRSGIGRVHRQTLRRASAVPRRAAARACSFHCSMSGQQSALAERDTFTEIER